MSISSNLVDQTTAVLRLLGRFTRHIDAVLSAGTVENARRAAVDSTTRRQAFLAVRGDRERATPAATSKKAG